MVGSTGIGVPGLVRMGMLRGNHGSKLLRRVASLKRKIHAMEAVDGEMANFATDLTMWA